jgi:hypothetical protein
MAGILGMTLGRAPKQPTKVVDKASEPAVVEPIDVSIPYEATFEQAYDAFRGEVEYNQAQYEAFKKTYAAMVVAQVTAKKNIRDFKRLEQDLVGLKKVE